MPRACGTCGQISCVEEIELRKAVLYATSCRSPNPDTPDGCHHLRGNHCRRERLGGWLADEPAPAIAAKGKLRISFHPLPQPSHPDSRI
jgi:hypothetical protein